MNQNTPIPTLGATQTSRSHIKTIFNPLRSQENNKEQQTQIPVNQNFATAWHASV